MLDDDQKPQPIVTPPKKNVLLGEFFLYLSRACLGKNIVVAYKWLKKYFFLSPKS
jgi:hypothetical protein